MLCELCEICRIDVVWVIREDKEGVGKVCIKVMPWPPEISSRVGRVLALRPSPGAEELLMPGQASGRVASMPSFKFSHEPTDLSPMVEKDWWLSPILVPKEPEATKMRQNHFMAPLLDKGLEEDTVAIGCNEVCGWIMCSFSPWGHIITNNDLSPRDT